MIEVTEGEEPKTWVAELSDDYQVVIEIYDDIPNEGYVAVGSNHVTNNELKRIADEIGLDHIDR